MITLISKILILFSLMAFTSGYNKGQLNRWRYFDNRDKELKEDIRHTADSLVANWKEWALKQPIE